AAPLRSTAASGFALFARRPADQEREAGADDQEPAREGRVMTLRLDGDQYGFGPFGSVASARPRKTMTRTIGTNDASRRTWAAGPPGERRFSGGRSAQDPSVYKPKIAVQQVAFVHRSRFSIAVRHSSDELSRANVTRRFDPILKLAKPPSTGSSPLRLSPRL